MRRVVLIRWGWFFAFLVSFAFILPKAAAWYDEQRLEGMDGPALQAWSASHPEDALGHFYLGMALGRSGRPTEAAAQLSRALDLDPSLSRARWRLARLLVAASRDRDAESLLLQGLRLDPNAPTLHAGLGRLYEDRQQFRPAAAEWQKAASLAPRDVDSWYHLGRCWMGVNDDARALRAYRRAADLTPSSPTYQKALAGVLRLVGRYREAEAHYRRARALDPHDPDVHFGLAKVLWDRDGATAEAEQNLRQAVALEPDSPLLHYTLADLCRQRGSLQAAREQYQAALSLLKTREPLPAAAWAVREQWLARLEGPHFNLARLLGRLGRSAEAAGHLAQFRRISDYRNHANQLLVRMANRPGEAALHFDLARLHASAGFPRLAEEQYRAGLRLHPDSRAQAELRALGGSGKESLHRRTPQGGRGN
jgi:tetratricopeptide (TPR) repeat protein